MEPCGEGAQRRNLVRTTTGRAIPSSRGAARWAAVLAAPHGDREPVLEALQACEVICLLAQHLHLELCQPDVQEDLKLPEGKLASNAKVGTQTEGRHLRRSRTTCPPFGVELLALPETSLRHVHGDPPARWHGTASLAQINRLLDFA